MRREKGEKPLRKKNEQPPLVVVYVCVCVHACTQTHIHAQVRKGERGKTSKSGKRRSEKDITAQARANAAQETSMLGLARRCCSIELPLRSSLSFSLFSVSHSLSLSVLHSHRSVSSGRSSSSNLPRCRVTAAAARRQKSRDLRLVNSNRKITSCSLPCFASFFRSSTFTGGFSAFRFSFALHG